MTHPNAHTQRHASRCSEKTFFASEDSLLHLGDNKVLLSRRSLAMSCAIVLHLRENRFFCNVLRYRPAPPREQVLLQCLALSSCTMLHCGAACGFVKLRQRNGRRPCKWPQGAPCCRRVNHAAVWCTMLLYGARCCNGRRVHDAAVGCTMLQWP